MAKRTKIMFQPLMRRLAGHGHDNRYAVRDEGSHALLMEIKGMLDVFAPIGDDLLHGLWIEVPRGKPSDWASFKEMKEWGDVNSRKEYLKQWKSEFPRETYWYFVSVSQYRGHTYLHITDHDSRWCIIHDDVRWDRHSIGPVDWYLEPLLVLLKEKVAEIVKDVEAYNRYVDEYLPKRQRTGRIARKDLNRIVPWQRRRPRNVKKIIKMLKECIANETVYRMTEPKLIYGEFRRLEQPEKKVALPASYREPLPKMSIRIYAKYFRVAYEAYEKHFSGLRWRSRRERKEYREFLEESAAMTDIEFYRRYQHGRHGEITDETDFDSEEAFKKMAYDHYGELGLSRNNVHATGYYTPGKWLITFGVSYSAWVDAGCEIALALYEAGAPLLVYDAQKMLDILEERDFVMLTPHTFHDYLNHHEEGSVFDLPYECYLGDGDDITREQYDEIVALAEWKPEVQVTLDETVPLEDEVYDPIREEVADPLTVSEILERLYEKYGVGVGIGKYRDHQHIYLYGWKKGDEKIQIKGETFMPANEAMLAVLRMFAGEYNNSNKEELYGNDN